MRRKVLSPHDPIKVVRIIARLNIGGPAILVALLNDGLTRYNVESLLLTGTENPGEGSMLDYVQSKNVHPLTIPEMVGEASFKYRDIQTIAKITRTLMLYRPHIVHTHTAKAGFVGRVAARLARVPILLHTYHGHVLHGYYSPWKNQLLRRMEQSLAMITDCICADSEQVRRDLLTYHVAPPEKIRVLPLGLELDAFLRAEEHRGTFRQELGIDATVPLIGIVGRIVPIKNHRLFLDAATLIAEQFPSAQFVIVGDGTLRTEMETYAHTCGIAHRVIFTGWRRDLPRIYADLDILVVSSDNEGMPVSAIEAMAAQRPVVSTHVGGLPDLIHDHETGFLVPPNDAPRLANAISYLLNHPDVARTIGHAARLAVESQFTATRLIDEMDTLYRHLLRQKGLLS